MAKSCRHRESTDDGPGEALGTTNRRQGWTAEWRWHIQELIGQTQASKPSLGVARTTLVVTHDTELLRRLRPRIVMIFEGRVRFDGGFDAFVESEDPHIRPYIEQMPLLHSRIDGGAKSHRIQIMILDMESAGLSKSARGRTAPGRRLR